MKCLVAVLLLAGVIAANAGMPAEQSPNPADPGELNFISIWGNTMEGLDRTRASCNAFSFLRVRTTGGKCSGRAKAECEAVAASLSAIADAYQDWWIKPEDQIPIEEQVINEDGSVEDAGTVDEARVCDEGFALAAAQAIGTASAEVWTSALVKVSCDGQGFACGWSAGNGEAWAVAFAEAIAIAAADAGADSVNGFCYADVRALASAFAEAQATVQAGVCTKGGTEEDYREDYSLAVVDAIANAFANATATACQSDEAKATSDCFGEAEAVASPFLAVGMAAGGQVFACQDGQAFCCDPEQLDNRICGCDDCNGPLIQVIGDDAVEDGAATWRDQLGGLCFCDDN